MTDLTIDALDGYRLAATRFDAANPEAVMLVSPATGVKRSLYRAFAEHMRAAGITTITWDWRGTGGSKPATLKHFPYDMRDWAVQDLGGVIEWAFAGFPGLKLIVIGHSFGGQAIGLTPKASKLSGAILVSAQSGYWGHYFPVRKFLYAALWYAVMPGLTKLVGWFPSRRLGLGEDLPPEVARQWARWCRSPDYIGDWSGHEAVTAPMMVWGFSDDSYATPKAVRALFNRYANAPQLRRIIEPHHAGVKRIGHFGFFRPGIPKLWDETIAWIRTVD